ncbi:heavy metal-binding domain-containing protein [Flavobacterium sp.]|uniref:heavy metal-binding domain-containing protein n=1 Tax=Flavobacterium sp. TaxID=239 RepID=UPI0025C3BCA1|nr:heavy metal-binding domain-containing protein [Flavobacterium sp.]
MKKSIISALVIVFVAVSCNQKNNNDKTSDSVKTDVAEQKYACPMHPEVQGKSTDKCSKCGMDLTEQVK